MPVIKLISLIILALSFDATAFFLTPPSKGAQNINIHPGLRVVADSDIEEKRDKSNKGGDNDSDWIPSKNGGFIPNIKGRIRRRPQILQVFDIQKYKEEVVDVRDRLVVVRFFAPWCRACRAVQGRFNQLSLEFPSVKFVEVPLTKENAYLHDGLGVPSLPFAHIYEPCVGLVEEKKISKVHFREFKTCLQTYVDGQCPVNYDESAEKNRLTIER